MKQFRFEKLRPCFLQKLADKFSSSFIFGWLKTGVIIFFISSCQADNEQTATQQGSLTDPGITAGTYPAWSARTAVYQVNIRQHTPEGTINAFRKKLPELKKLGVNTLWIMPVQPIGVENRQGKLGNPYAIRNYTAVSREYGSMDDFKNMVTAAHDLGFKVLLDWPAHQTARDHDWASSHPDWYSKNATAATSDVATLNFEADSLRLAMQEAMKFWIRETGIDGFYCGDAEKLPLDFWKETRMMLDSLKLVFMLAGTQEARLLDTAFDMLMGSGLYAIMQQMASGAGNPASIDSFYNFQASLFADDDMFLYYVTNAHENAQSGSASERLGRNLKNFFLLSASFPNGAPLLYSGQEYGNPKQLLLYDKDTIPASDSSLFDWYSSILKLKMNHPALANAGDEGTFENYAHHASQGVYAYSRMKGKEGLLVLLNFADEPLPFDLAPVKTGGKWTDALSGKAIEMTKADQLTIGANSYALIKIMK